MPCLARFAVAGNTVTRSFRLVQLAATSSRNGSPRTAWAFTGGILQAGARGMAIPFSRANSIHECPVQGTAYTARTKSATA
jgi:hypothetical protein